MVIDEPYPGHHQLRWRVDGKRFSKMFRGSLAEARRELRRLLKTADDGTHVVPDRQTLVEYLRDWLDNDTGLSPKTLERYKQLTERQISPHLGTALLQKLRPVQVHAWHSTLLKSGLHPRTVGHPYRVLHRGVMLVSRKCLYLILGKASGDADAIDFEEDVRPAAFQT